MSNPLFDQFGNTPNNGILQQFNNFRRNFRGDPQQQIQQMLNSGRITQDQYNQAVQKAQMLQRMFGIK